MAAAKISYLESLDNLLTALEMYRDVEKKTIQRMQEIMKEHGISSSHQKLNLSIHRTSESALRKQGKNTEHK